MSYFTPEELRAAVGTDLVADEEWLSTCALAARQAVDTHCGQSFIPPAANATAVTRVYRPLIDVVQIDPLADLTGVIVADSGATITSGLQWEPLNQLGADGALVAIDGVRRIDSCWTRNDAEATVSITSARWGWPAVPPAVKQASIVLAKDLVHLRDNRFGVAGFGEFGAVRIRQNPHVEMLLRPFRSWRTIGIA